MGCEIFEITYYTGFQVLKKLLFWSVFLSFAQSIPTDVSARSQQFQYGKRNIEKRLSLQLFDMQKRRNLSIEIHMSWETKKFINKNEYIFNVKISNLIQKFTFCWTS